MGNLNLKQNSFWKITLWVVVILIVGFHLNNFIRYDSKWGYDAMGHSKYFLYIADHLKLPTVADTSLADNPPFYYIISAIIFKLTSSLKLVQLLSLVLLFVELYLLSKCLNKISTNKLLNISILALFSLLPISMNLGYMVMNYPLGFFLGITAFYILFNSIIDQKLNFKNILILSIVMNIGLLTALNNLSFWILTLGVILLFPKLKFNIKLKYLAVFLFATVAINAPYYLYKTKVYNCFFCTKHRNVTNLKFNQVYPLKFYYTFDLKYLNEPYFDKLQSANVMLPLLHTTLYGDYFNYIVETKFERTTTNPPGTAHLITEKKIKKLIGLNYLGLPISIILLITLLISIKEGVKFIILKERRYFIDFFLSLAVILNIAQFLAYIHKYPDYVNIHSGYLYATVFILAVSIGRYLNYKKLNYLFTIIFGFYFFMSYYTFLMF